MSGVWGSAFSIYFNRLLPAKDSAGGSTMEEEIGNFSSSEIFFFLFFAIYHLSNKPEEAVGYHVF